MRVVFVDETGTSDLDYSKQGVQRYFVLTGVICEREGEDVIRSQADTIRARHFQTGPFRSSTVGPNLRRRLRILGDLSTLPVKFYCWAVDKAEVSRNGGLIYKVPFIRYMHGQFYSFLLNRALYREQGDTRIVAEQYGDDSFMKGQEKYLRKHFGRLFPRFEFEYRDKSDPMLGLADFIGGSLVRCVDPNYAAEDTTGIREALRDQFLGVEEYPPKFIWQLTPEERGTEHDQEIRRAIVERARAVAESIDEDTDSAQAQKVVLRRLVFQLVNQSPGEAIYGDVLIRDIEDELGVKFDKRSLNADVIGKLRSAGVVIVGSENGYKLPRSLSEIEDWLGFTDRKVSPMVRRLEVACDAVKSITDIDLLADPRWAHIRAAADKIRQGSFGRALEEAAEDEHH